MSKTQMHTVRLPLCLELNILILVAFQWFWISTIYPSPWSVLAFPSLASISCSVPPVVLATLLRYLNSLTSSRGTVVKQTVCKQSVIAFMILLLSLLTLNPTELAVVSKHRVFSQWGLLPLKWVLKANVIDMQWAKNCSLKEVLVS